MVLIAFQLFQNISNLEKKNYFHKLKVHFLLLINKMLDIFVIMP